MEITEPTLRRIASRAGLLRHFDRSSSFRARLENRLLQYARQLDAELDTDIVGFLPPYEPYAGLRRRVFSDESLCVPRKPSLEFESDPKSADARQGVLRAAETVLLADLAAHDQIESPWEEDETFLRDEIVGELHGMELLTTRRLGSTTIDLCFDPNTGLRRSDGNGAIARFRAVTLSMSASQPVLFLWRKKSLLSSFGKLAVVTKANAEVCPSPCMDHVGCRVVVPDDDSWERMSERFAEVLGEPSFTPSPETSGEWIAHHYYVRLGQFRLPVEIQVMPLHNWLDANSAHKKSTFRYDQAVFVKRVLPALRRETMVWGNPELLHPQDGRSLAEPLHEFATQQILRDLNGRPA